MSDILVAAGAVALCAGLFLIALPVGLVGTGAVLILAGGLLAIPKQTRE